MGALRRTTPDILLSRPFMTHAFISSVARRFQYAALRSRLSSAFIAFIACSADASVSTPPSIPPRRVVTRANAAWPFVCAALVGSASLPLAAEARVKATHPSVNVSTVLPQSVMIGLQRAHRAVVVDQRGRRESRRPHADRRVERRASR